MKFKPYIGYRGRVIRSKAEARRDEADAMQAFDRAVQNLWHLNRKNADKDEAEDVKMLQKRHGIRHA